MDHNQAIANLEYRFFEDLDNRRFEAVGAMFAHGTLEIVVPGRPEPFAGTGEAEVTGFLSRMIPAKDDGSWGRHIGSNLIIELDEAAGTASARMNSALFHVAPGKPSHFMGLGRHEDEFKLIDGAWWFARKTITGEVRYPPPGE